MDIDSTLAVCDPDAFYPFRSLVHGSLRSPEELEMIERFLRAVVLHDEIAMDLEPHAGPPEDDDEEWTEEEIEAGERSVIVAFGPVIDEYGLFSDEYRNRPKPEVKLSPEQLELASSYSNAGPGNVYYKAHIEYLQRLFSVVEEGGSVLCEGSFGRAAIERATEVPAQLFESLDADWREYAKRIQSGRLGIMIPPVLAIILSRCARRDAIPGVVRDLRDEWGQGRRKVWQLIGDLKKARTLKQTNEIERELAEASKLFSPKSVGEWSSPLRMLWNFSLASGKGAATSAISGGTPGLGALTAIVAQVTRFLRSQTSDGRRLFGRGAFDLARRVSHAAASVEADPQLLSRFLTAEERRALGY